MASLKEILENDLEAFESALPEEYAIQIGRFRQGVRRGAALITEPAETEVGRNWRRVLLRFRLMIVDTNLEALIDAGDACANAVGAGSLASRRLESQYWDSEGKEMYVYNVEYSELIVETGSSGTGYSSAPPAQPPAVTQGAPTVLAFTDGLSPIMAVEAIENETLTINAVPVNVYLGVTTPLQNAFVTSLGLEGYEWNPAGGAGSIGYLQMAVTYDAATDDLVVNTDSWADLGIASYWRLKYWKVRYTLTNIVNGQTLSASLSFQIQPSDSPGPQWPDHMYSGDLKLGPSTLTCIESDSNVYPAEAKGVSNTTLINPTYTVESILILDVYGNEAGYYDTSNLTYNYTTSEMTLDSTNTSDNGLLYTEVGYFVVTIFVSNDTGTEVVEGATQAFSISTN